MAIKEVTDAEVNVVEAAIAQRSADIWETIKTMHAEVGGDARDVAIAHLVNRVALLELAAADG